MQTHHHNVDRILALAHNILCMTGILDIAVELRTFHCAAAEVGCYLHVVCGFSKCIDWLID